jgi:site-specific DNA-methyltransferase (adenine-specific)
MAVSDLIKSIYDKPGVLSDEKPTNPGTINLIFGDCLEEMAKLKPNSVDMILVDTPYGVTACKWDTIIPLDKMWTQIKRVIKPKGAVVLTATQPYTSMLVMSNLEWFKYEWIWDKVTTSNPLNVKIMPLLQHESILVFGEGNLTYNRQFSERKLRDLRPNRKKNSLKLQLKASEGGVYGPHKSRLANDYDNTLVNPRSILRFSRGGGWTRKKQHHPTQKPLELGRYLVKTYMNEGQTFLDFTCGSGSFVKAAYLEGMNVIGIDNGYCEREKEINKIQLKGLSWVEITRLRLENLLP